MTYRTLITKRPSGTLALLSRTLEEALVMVPYDGVDIEYMSWVADWIEDNSHAYWEDGEPWLPSPEGLTS